MENRRVEQIPIFERERERERLEIQFFELPGQGALPSQHVLQLFTLAKNCLERAESIYTTAQGEGRSLTAGGQQLSAQQSNRCVLECM